MKPPPKPARSETRRTVRHGDATSEVREITYPVQPLSTRPPRRRG